MLNINLLYISNKGFNYGGQHNKVIFLYGKYVLNEIGCCHKLYTMDQY